jgi:hypothetical protein
MSDANWLFEQNKNARLPSTVCFVLLGSGQSQIRIPQSSTGWPARLALLAWRAWWRAGLPIFVVSRQQFMKQRASELLLDNSLQVSLKTVNLDRELFNKITSL